MDTIEHLHVHLVSDARHVVVAIPILARSALATIAAPPEP
jgi:hypothetical protein